MKKIFGILSASILSCGIASAQTYAPTQTSKTPYGEVSIIQNHLYPTSVLLFKGEKTAPRITGNNSLDIVQTITDKNVDYVILRSNGGELCPARYSIVSVSDRGAFPTNFFGTCSDSPDIKKVGLNIVIEMPDLKGKKHKFIYENSHMTDNGHTVNLSCRNGQCDNF